ncbi:mechanosensitive ion channel family protein, partial [Glaesserella parasuis]|uniref:mechanosensitive ion channel family protein n=1 Tax=Glaesserella parasuis TaxID=738 RepID=UPI003F3E365C
PNLLGALVVVLLGFVIAKLLDALLSKLLAKLGRDCSMVCRIRGAAWTERPTPSKQWLKERAYPFDIIREVFELNPDTAPYIPKG